MTVTTAQTSYEGYPSEVTEVAGRFANDPALVVLAREQFSLQPLGSVAVPAESVPLHQDAVVLGETANILERMADELPAAMTEHKITARVIAVRLRGKNSEGEAHGVRPADLDDADIIISHFQNLQRTSAAEDAESTAGEPVAAVHATHWAPHGTTGDADTYEARQAAITLNTLLTCTEASSEPLDTVLATQLRAMAGPYLIARK